MEVKGKFIGTIQGTERKNFFHVWWLKIDTTVECLEKHFKKYVVRTLLVIGVPQSKYDLLCQPKNSIKSFITIITFGLILYLQITMKCASAKLQPVTFGITPDTLSLNLVLLAFKLRKCPIYSILCGMFIEKSQ